MQILLSLQSNSPKIWDSEEKPVFMSRLPLRCHIAQLATFLVDPGNLLSLYARAYHPHTTTGDWTISWPSEDSLVEVVSTECSWYLVFEPFLHARLFFKLVLKVNNLVITYHLHAKHSSKFGDNKYSLYITWHSIFSRKLISQYQINQKGSLRRQ